MKCSLWTGVSNLILRVEMQTERNALSVGI